MALCKFVNIPNKLKLRFDFVRHINTTSIKNAADQPEEIKIPVPWGHVAGKWWGDRNKIPVLALHGWQDNANSFDRLIPQLTLPAVLAIDFPGHGQSSHLPKGKTYNFLETVILMHQIINHYQWAKVSLLTHSLGGCIGFAYASIFPDKVKWFINFECGRTLLTLPRYNLSAAFSNAWTTLNKIENKDTDFPPAYKLSEMVHMVVEGSFGSISSPDSAMTLLQRGIYLANESSVSKKKIEKTSLSTDLHALIQFELKAAELLSPEEQEELKRYYSKKIEIAMKAKENMKNFKLDEEKDKYYCFSRDPLIKVETFQSVSSDFVMKGSKLVKCPVLSMRASNGFLYGSTKKLYENSLSELKTNCSYFEHREVEGTHHAHLNNPENLAPIINTFVQKFADN